jgi:hypothetical protein
MKKMLVGLALTTTLLVGVGPAFAYDDGGSYGDGNQQDRCHRSENCRGSFSPGPFDRSPVDASHNTFCIGPNSCPPPPSSPPNQGGNPK